MNQIISLYLCHRDREREVWRDDYVESREKIIDILYYIECVRENRVIIILYIEASVSIRVCVCT